jgi:hypothetical protein
MAIDVGSTRKGEWMQTYTGRKFYPADPHGDEVDIMDIAASLSNMCRYGGHCLRFYSVAEHAVHVAANVPNEFKLTALMHDASEAYLVDIPRPLKPSLTNYYELENQLMSVISKKFGTTWPLPDEVKYADNAILRDERAQNMASLDVPPEVWGDKLPALGARLQFWTPDRAKNEFLIAFLHYGGKWDGV